MSLEYLGWKIPYKTASATKTWFPAAKVALQIDGKMMDLAVGVTQHIEVDMLLGQDIPHFRKLLKEALEVEGEPLMSEWEGPTTHEIASEVTMVVTRAQQKNQMEQERQEKIAQSRDEAISYSLEQEPVVEESKTEDEGTNLVPELSMETVTPEQLRKLQKEDTTLATVCKKADSGAGLFLWKEGLLMQESYNPSGKRLLMVLKNIHTQVLRLAHASLTGGHFGQARMVDALRTRLDWPGVAKDVQDVCRSRPVCQKMAPAVVMWAPLHPLSIIKTPFSRIAMDIFGPLQRTSSGSKYDLVIVDYESKWPEAYPLRNMTSETVVNCLVDYTARFGVPEEVLTDNGANFVSKVMKKFCEALGIRQIRTYPYHPQTNGMVVRYNATLKRLLRKLISVDILFCE